MYLRLVASTLVMATFASVQADPSSCSGLCGPDRRCMFNANYKCCTFNDPFHGPLWTSQTQCIEGYTQSTNTQPACNQLRRCGPRNRCVSTGDVCCKRHDRYKGDLYGVGAGSCPQGYTQINFG